MIMIVGSIGNILDGNIYLVSQGENIRQTQQTDFDGMINQISSGSESLDDIFKEVSDEYGVDLNLLKAVAKAECQILIQRRFQAVAHRELCSLCQQQPSHLG